MKNKLLLVEDEDTLSDLLTEFLEEEGYEVYRAHNGEEGFSVFNHVNPDICLFDVMMPKISGFTLLERIRAENNRNVPVVFLSAKALKEDVVSGLRLGADDYITKPFNFQELNLRLKNILKRTSPLTNQRIYHIGDYIFTASSQRLKFQAELIELTSMEASILELLCENRNNTLERKKILRHFWGCEDLFNFRSIDVFVSKLRKYLKKDESVRIISVRGKGYKLVF